MDMQVEQPNPKYGLLDQCLHGTRHAVGFILGSVLFNTFINDLDKGIKQMFIEFSANIKLGVDLEWVC